MKTTRRFGLTAAVAAALVMAFSSGPAMAAAKTLRLGHTGALDHHYQKGSEMFKKLVEERSKGTLLIQIYPSDQLGTQRELVEGAQLGTVDMVLTSDVLLSSFEPTLSVLTLPYLFQNIEQVAKVMDGPIGDELAANLEKKGLTVVGYWENGFRHVTNSKRPVVKPEDMKGLKIRTPKGPVFVDTFNAYGASATPMGFGEIYTALQLGVVDGEENPIAHILTQKFYEVQKYLSLTSHIHSVEPLLISTAVFKSLSADQQKLLKQAGKDTAVWVRKEVDRIEAAQLKQLEGKIAINKADTVAFEAASEPVYAKYESKFGSLIKRIKAAR